MQNNYLKLNADKTGILLVGAKTSLFRVLNFSVNIDGVDIKPAQFVKNLGCLLDSSLTFESHIKLVTKTAFYHLRNIARLRPMLSDTDAKMLINAFIFSRIDYCNSLFYGLPAKLINRLQYIQNSAARVLTSTKRTAHSVLRQLHWLPISSRIKYSPSSYLQGSTWSGSDTPF